LTDPQLRSDRNPGACFCFDDLGHGDGLAADEQCPVERGSTRLNQTRRFPPLGFVNEHLFPENRISAFRRIMLYA
jgi:hypothetical protein